MRTISFFLLIFTLTSCSKETTQPIPGDPTLPSGQFTVTRSGTFQSQNGYAAAGLAELGTDATNTQWLHLAPNFTASLSTGAVVLYLSKNQNLSLNAAGSFLRVEAVKTPGEHYYKIDPAVADDFIYAILWCSSAGVQFGNASMQ
jgi:hypothetical protein